MASRDQPQASPKLTAESAAAREARARRLSEALRENLKRRKAQARGRSADAPAGSGGKSS